VGQTGAWLRAAVGGAPDLHRERTLARRGTVQRTAGCPCAPSTAHGPPRYQEGAPAGPPVGPLPCRSCLNADRGAARPHQLHRVGSTAAAVYKEEPPGSSASALPGAVSPLAAQ